MPTNNSSSKPPETPPPASGCPPSSDAPIAYANGQIVLSSTDISWKGLGFSWSHSRSYANVLEGGSVPSEMGHHWFLSDIPFLTFGTEPGTGDATVNVVFGTYSSQWFKADGSGGWEARFGSHAVLTHDTAAREFILTSPGGLRTIFHDDDGGLSQSIRGRLKAIENPGGAQAIVTYNIDDELESLAWTDEDGNTAIFSYTYYDDLERLGLLESVTLSVNGRPVRRTSYDFYGLNAAHGPLRTLRNALVEELGEDGDWRTIREEWLRYFTETTTGTWKYGIKLRLDAEGAAAARAAGILLDSATDAALEPYASHTFVYDGQANGSGSGRVTSETVRGGEATYSFSWLTNATDPLYSAVNTWYRKSVETRPDQSQRTVYTNRGGSMILSILEEAGAIPKKWYDYYEYDSDYHVIKHASSEAVQSVSEPANASGILTVTLKTDAGLINLNDYYSADDFPNGEVKGYLKTTSVQEGTGGAIEIISKQTYDTKTINGVSLHPVKERFEYPVAGSSDADAAKTVYARTWHTDSLGGATFQVKQLTTTLPVVSATEHGTGLDEETEAIFDADGFLTWEKDARGVITRHYYDNVTGAQVRRIDDADPDKLIDPPLGWVAPSFGGAHLITDYEVDGQGRTLRAIGSEHTVLIDGESVEPCQTANVEAQLVRRVRYTLYLDNRHQTWAAQGYVVGYGTAEATWHLLGPVDLSRRDFLDRPVDAIQVRPACSCGALSLQSLGKLEATTQLPNRSLWTRWTHTERDLWGRDIEERAYFEIPLEGKGFQGDHYWATTYGYNEMNRRHRTTGRDGTINWTVFDTRSLPTESWVGTDASGATDADPGNGGQDGNNLKAVELLEYDDNAGGGNGNLTEQRRPVDDTSTNDRVVTHAYDYRNRRIRTEADDGTPRLFLAVIDYDNLNQPISGTIYHSGVAEGNCIARAETKYDKRSRPYEQKTWGVDPSTGNLTNALIAGTWYDPNGNVIQQTAPGSGQSTKTEYDALNRDIVQYMVVPGALPTGTPANDVSDDIVVEQSEITYDRGGDPTVSARRQRLHDSTGKGALGNVSSAEPRARVSFVVNYFDPIGRQRYTSNYGTNGGAALVRPDLPAKSSGTILINETRYAADGQPGNTIGPDGRIDRTEFNKLGQPRRIIEAVGSDAERVFRFRWHPSGQMSHLILEDPETGEQVTEWIFGTTLSSSEVARNDLIVAKVWPTGEPESLTYNRQGNTASRTDPNGSIREFTYDKLGQPVDDTATTIGSGVDDALRRVSISYNNQQLRDTVTTYSDIGGGSANVINQVQFEYDAFGNVTADRQEHDGEVDTSTATVSYGFTDGSSNLLRRTSMTIPSGSQVDVAYGTSGSIDDVFNRVSSLKVNGETHNLVEYTYAGLGRVVTLKYPTPDAELSYLKPSGTTGTGDAGDDMTGYDRFGRTVRMPWKNATSSNVLADIAYGYDPASRRKWRQDLTPDADNAFDRFYVYDTLGQVTSADRGTLNENRTAIGGIPGQAELWRYDEQGNWIDYDKGEGGVSVIGQSRWHNQSNQITAIDSESDGVAYDNNGNMIRVPTGDDLTGAPRKLIWNAWDQLVEVRVESSNALLQANAYDGLFRRTTRTLADNTVVHSYFNERWKSVEDRLDASTDPESIYYWGPRPGHRDDLIRRDRDTNASGTIDESLWCLMDYFDPIATLNASGAVQERYTYSAFGVPEILAPDYSVRSSSAFDWNFLFHGQYTDPETGFQDYGYRYLDNSLGVWLSRDPLDEVAGPNLYLYTRNNPCNRVDWKGLLEESDPACDGPIRGAGIGTPGFGGAFSLPSIGPSATLSWKANLEFAYKECCKVCEGGNTDQIKWARGGGKATVGLEIASAGSTYNFGGDHQLSWWAGGKAGFSVSGEITGFEIENGCTGKNEDKICLSVRGAPSVSIGAGATFVAGQPSNAFGWLIPPGGLRFDLTLDTTLSGGVSLSGCASRTEKGPWVNEGLKLCIDAVWEINIDVYFIDTTIIAWEGQKCWDLFK